MYKKRKPKILTIICSGILSAIFCFCVATSNFFNINSTIWVAGLLCAPAETISATKTLANNNNPLAVPTAQTQIDDDWQSGFITVLPSEQDDVSQNPTIGASSNENIQAISPQPPQSTLAPEGAGSIIEKTYQQGTNAYYVSTGNASVYNLTTYDNSIIEQSISQPLPFDVEINSSEPQVLIYHTHATECYEAEDRTWWEPDSTSRTTDITQSVVAVGAVIATQLNANGINTIHAQDLHDYPSYTAAYGNSRVTVQHYLDLYPSIKIVLDVHRDAIAKEDGTRIKPVVEINGKKNAQIMIISCADKGGNIPNFQQNLTFASKLAETAQTMYNGLMRPVMFDERFYNQDLSTGALLLEMGGHANTLQECILAGEKIGKALSVLLIEN